jgi:hypothetical protein
MEVFFYKNYWMMKPGVQVIIIQKKPLRLPPERYPSYRNQNILLNFKIPYFENTIQRLSYPSSRGEWNRNNLHFP